MGSTGNGLRRITAHATIRMQYGRATQVASALRPHLRVVAENAQGLSRTRARHRPVSTCCHQRGLSCRPDRPTGKGRVSSRNAIGERFGITQKSFDLITESISARPEIEPVLIFGSRAINHDRPLLRGGDRRFPSSRPLVLPYRRANEGECRAFLHRDYRKRP